MLTLKKFDQAIAELLICHKKLLDSKKGLFQNAFYKFPRSAHKKHESILGMYSATRLLTVVSTSVLHKLIPLFRHNFIIDEYTLHLTSVKINHPKITKICFS